MAAFGRPRALVAGIIVLGVAAGIVLWRVGGSGPAKQVVAQPTPSVLGTEAHATETSQPSARETPRVHAIDVPGPLPEDAITLQTVSDGALGRTIEQAIIWRTNGELKTQLFPAAPETGRPPPGPFDDVNSAIIDGVQQLSGDRRELGIVYDATAYGSGSPTAMFVLLRLEGDQWHIVWTATDHPADWRFAHGRVEFPQGDLSELIVRSDSAFGHDPLSGVLFEANAGPHRGFVDTWVRLGDGYTLASAVTVPSAYATLVEFMYALGTGGDATARALVTDAALVDTARSMGLDGALGKNWMIGCDCEAAGPITFYQGPPVKISFVEQHRQWLISAITSNPAP